MRCLRSSPTGWWRRWTPFALVVVGLMAVGLALGGIRLDAAFDLNTLVPEIQADNPVPDQGRNLDLLPVEEDPPGEFSFWAVIVIGAVLATPMIVMLIRMIARPADQSSAPRPAQEEPVIAAAGEVRAALRAALAERKWTCAGCGTVHDREVNASTSLLTDMLPALEALKRERGQVAA